MAPRHSRSAPRATPNSSEDASAPAAKHNDLGTTSVRNLSPHVFEIARNWQFWGIDFKKGSDLLACGAVVGGGSFGEPAYERSSNRALVDPAESIKSLRTPMGATITLRRVSNRKIHIVHGDKQRQLLE